MSGVEERSYVETSRRDKRAALEALGVPAFAYRFDRTHTAREALALYEGEGDRSLANRVTELLRDPTTA